MFFFDKTKVKIRRFLNPSRPDKKNRDTLPLQGKGLRVGLQNAGYYK
jgi:hypothetical protein